MANFKKICSLNDRTFALLSKDAEYVTFIEKNETDVENSKRMAIFG